ncbi:MAG TPA: PIN domain-containing protein [Longimicrobium sp.]|nr:PIN domain-containing protein [Longimicrobium sp.]
MKLLLDINILLDLFLQRHPWDGEAALLLSAVENGQPEGYVAGHTITTVHYVVARAKDRRVAAMAVTDLLRIVRVVPVEAADFHQALVLGLSDFEDAVQVAAGLKIGADFVVTRDEKHFRGGPLPPRSPREVLALL